jgi:hyperosmotically inducible protein
MKLEKLSLGLAIPLVVGLAAGCSHRKTPDVTASVRMALDGAGLNNVTVSDNRDRGVVTLGGQVASDADKTRAESVAEPAAAGQVVADQIQVIPPNAENEAKTVNSDLDAGIKKNVDAELVRNRLNHAVKVDVKNGVVTLKGDVSSSAVRTRAEKIASSVPNVTQVVNEIDIKHHRATSTPGRRSAG